jgi:hypothetical protein
LIRLPLWKNRTFSDDEVTDVSRVKNNGLNKREVSPVIAENLMSKILTRASKNLDGVMLWQDF